MNKKRECIRAEAIDFTFYFYVNGLRIGATLFVLGSARVCTAIGAAVDAMQHQRAVRRHFLTSAGRQDLTICEEKARGFT